MNAAVEMQSTARILDVTEDEYFRDPCQVPSLSQSIAQVMIEESPLHAWSRHPRLGGAQLEVEEDPRETAAKQRGKAMHRLILGKGADVAVLAADNFRLKASQEWKKERLAEGKVPMLARVYDEMVAAVETIRGNLAMLGVEFEGESEVAIEWRETGEHGPVLCRGRLDHIIPARGRIYDLKTIRSAHPDMCGKHSCEFGYFIQDAAYRSALSKLHPELEGRVEMIYLFVEVEPPYAVNFGPLDGELRELGETYWQRAIFLWERCLRRNEWPAYVDPRNPMPRIMAPGWYAKRLMEAAELWR